MDNKPVRVKLPLWKKLLFTAVIAASPLLLAESLMRSCGYGPRPDLGLPMLANTGKIKLSALEYFALCDRYLGMRNRPNGRYRAWYIHGTPLCTTDRFGYRNGLGWPGNGQSPIVLFVGDSLTFCSELDDYHTGPSEVARLLRHEFDVRVLNAGVRSYNTLQAKRMMLECLERFPQIKVAVYTFCGNDLEENLVPNFRAPFKAPFMAQDPETEKFREVEISDPAVPWGKGFIGWEPPPVVASAGTRITGWIEARCALFHRCLNGLRRIDFGPGNTLEFPDGKHVVPYSQHARWHDWAAQNGGHYALQQLLAEMDQICRSRGVAFLTTCASDGSDSVASQAMAVNCAEAGVQFVTIGKEFTGSPLDYASLRVDGGHDRHYGPVGAKTYAQALAPTLKQILRSQATKLASDVQADLDD